MSFIVDSPDLKTFIFMRVDSQIGPFKYGADDILSLDRDDLYIIQYEDIRGLLEEDLVHLL
jgi:hypothetical protein